MSDPLVMCLKKMESGLDWICFNFYPPIKEQI
jgi:hypothetical protein